MKPSEMSGNEIRQPNVKDNNPNIAQSVKGIWYAKAGGLFKQLNLYCIQQQFPEVSDFIFHN